MALWMEKTFHYWLSSIRQKEIILLPWNGEKQRLRVWKLSLHTHKEAGIVAPAVALTLLLLRTVVFIGTEPVYRKQPPFTSPRQLARLRQWIANPEAFAVTA